MTIRYTCPECQSTLKIRDEKAGTDAKCPKCKHAFVVPQPDSDDGIEIEEPPAADLPPVDLPVDMPIELTPEVASTEPFDPADFLANTPAQTRTTPNIAPPTPPTSASARKPSVAELMKDFENTKKSKDRDKARKTDAPARSTTPSAAETTGSAADALARAYQQKRDSASAAPPLTKEDARTLEQRAAASEFLKKRLIPGLAATFVLGYAWFWYNNREIYEGPPLYEVSGTVLQNGKPLPNATVEFGPADPSPDSQALSATAITDEQGRFRLKAFDSQFGAPAGNYNVGITSSSGVPLSIPENLVQQTVSPDGKNDFSFSL
jgi:predicted Zn finger-like uncharacterized protein